MAARRSIGVYQPRSRRSAMADALAEARLAMARFFATLSLGAAGLILFLASTAAIVALASYNSADASLDNATGSAPTNLLGSFGAIAADLLLQTFGIAAAGRAGAARGVGLRALTGRHLSHAMWRAIAWPLGTVLAAAGLGVFPAPLALPAGAGGLIGIAVAGLSGHVAEVYRHGLARHRAAADAAASPDCRWPSWPPGLRAHAVPARRSNVPAFFVWLGCSNAPYAQTFAPLLPQSRCGL